MLRIVQNQSAAGAKSYYAKADYYSEGQELQGHWGGKAAGLLGLEGVVEREAFERLCDNRHPLTGKQLTPRNDTDRTVLYDFNYSVPKGVALAYALNGDERILDAFRASVHETMAELEADMKTRVRRADWAGDRTAGNLVYALFIHKTARPVAGVPDPFLHAHACVLNCTFDESEQRFKAGQFRDIKRDAPYFQAAFDARFGKRLTELGYEITRSGKQWDLAAIPPSLRRKFSRRTDQIEKLAAAQGIENPDEKAKLGAKSREKKAKQLSMSELAAVWDERLTAEDRQALFAAQPQPDQRQSTRARGAESRALDQALSQVFERNSVAPTRQILAEALRYGVGEVDVERTKEELANKEVIVRPLRGRPMATTKSVLAEEIAMLDWARNGRGKAQPLNPDWNIRREWLNAGQKAAVKHVLSSSDRVIMIAGKAGVGKTTLLHETCEGIEATGRQVFTFAPSAQAARKVLADEGFDATTVAHLLVDQQLQKQVAGHVLLIDEAGLIGTRTLKQVFDLAERNDCRVILCGDWKQHSSPGERGAAMRLLEQEAGIKPARVTAIQRQDGAYRDAVRLLSEGFTAEGFDKLDDLGWVKEIPGDDRNRQLARDYADGVERGEDIQVISPTHAESRLVTVAIRHELRERGLIAQEEQVLPRLAPLHLTAAERADPASYAAGDVTIVFHQNAKGFRKGARLAIQGELPEAIAKQAERFQAYRRDELPVAVGDVLRISANSTTKDKKHRLNNGATYEVAGFTKAGDVKLKNGWVVDRQFGLWDQGRVSTSHASQGRTCDRVFLAESSLSFPAAGREQAYVSLSRGRKQAVIYTDDKAALRDAIYRPELRLGATELVKDRRVEQVRRLSRLAAAARSLVMRQVAPQPEARKELSHDHS